MTPRNNRILLVDDNRSIHDDYRKILIGNRRHRAVIEAEAALFNQQPEKLPEYELTSVYQGEEALAAVEQAKAANTPFAMAFIDVRMPPGMDGIATAARIWQIDPDLQIVICTAYADHSWSDMTAQLGHPDQWVLLRKPFDNVEVLQLAHSLTEKWGLRQANKAQMADLESRVQARTADLVKALDELKRETAERTRVEEERRTMERKFEETQRLESLGVLAGGIAHDFNNILTGVLGSASLAKLEIQPGSSLDEHLNRIEKSACRAAELCEQMLAYAGKGQVALRQLDLNVLVRETMELLHASVPKDATLEVKLAPNLPFILADAGRMRQVIMNLVINAAEALGAHPRRVTLTTSGCALANGQLGALTFPGDAQAGQFVCIEVTDTGVGMSADTVRRIFEPFFTTKFTGRGLGLCAVQGIIRARGGALDVVSAIGQGSTFRVFLPASTLSAQTTPPITARPARAPVRGATILVVDDEPAVREIAGDALRREGYIVFTVSNGAQAVALFQQPQPIDGVLLDLTMPELDGVSTLQALRALRPGIRAVLMSGYEQHEAVRRFDGLGLAGFLQKPFTIDALREKAAMLMLTRPGANAR